MLLNLHKKTWMDGLSLQDYSEHCKLNEGTVNDMLELAKHYNKVIFFNLENCCFQPNPNLTSANATSGHDLYKVAIFLSH